MGFDPTAKEAKSIVARYDKDRSGSMELDEWAQLVSEFRRLQDRELADLRRDLSNLAELRSQLELAERAKAFPPDVRLIFDKYDRNRNGRLEHAELREALRAFGTKGGDGLEVSSREAKAKLAKYDRDKSGAMEIDEFAMLVAELRRSGYEIRDAELAELRRQLDGGGMGLGTGGGMGLGTGDTPADVRAAFGRFDVNGSGKLDYRELRAALQASPRYHPRW